MAASSQQNDVGTLIKVTILDENGAVVDISSATTKTITFKKPSSGTTVVKAASFFTDGTDGILKYATIDGDLDEVGTWRLQAYVALSTGSWKSSINTFTVSCNL